mmetsp:Transcript_28480/g.55365  ORF Transcript_28480/g.55365 Transcript_28480/m.55365 type:complete len:89 (-) Transcript_28480:38-304(-)
MAIQQRIVLAHVDEQSLGEMLTPMYARAFPMLDMEHKSLHATLKKLTVMIKPWESGCEKRIDQLGIGNPAVVEFVAMCLGQDVATTKR